MTDHENYKLPPIVEAVFDVFTVLPPEIDVKKMEEFSLRIKNDFPNKNESVAVNSSFGFKDGKPIIPSSNSFTRGYVLQNLQKDTAVQARVDGFTFNKLRPYLGFQPFVERAKPLWELYK